MCDNLLEAVCDYGANSSSPNSEISDFLRKTNYSHLPMCNKTLKAANGLPVDLKVFLMVHLNVGYTQDDYESHVLGNTETAGFLGIDFEVNQFDPLFWLMERVLDPNHSIWMSYKTFNYHTNRSLEL